MACDVCCVLRHTFSVTAIQKGISLPALQGHDQAAGPGVNLPPGICCHTFRATGITAYLENGGTPLSTPRPSPRTTKLYDRTGDAITLDEIERILI